MEIVEREKALGDGEEYDLMDKRTKKVGLADQPYLINETSDLELLSVGNRLVVRGLLKFQKSQ